MIRLYLKIQVCVSHSLGWILGCAYTTCSYGQIKFFSATPGWSPPLPVVSGFILFSCEFTSFSYYMIDRFVTITVVFWPSTRANMPFQSDALEGSDTSQWPVIERNRVRGIWLMKWDKLKIPWYTHRLMHRKRVTCELYDSYFRLMTIKHAIPKIEWAIKWALNYYITQSRQEIRQLELETRCGRETTPCRRGPRGPLMSWGPEKLLIRCGRESQHSAESWAPGPPVEQHWRTRKTQRWRP